MDIERWCNADHSIVDRKRNCFQNITFLVATGIANIPHTFSHFAFRTRLLLCIQLCVVLSYVHNIFGFWTRIYLSILIVRFYFHKFYAFYLLNKRRVL